MNDIFKEYDSHVRNERWEDACNIAQELTQTAPAAPTTWFNLGVCLEQTGQPFKAAEAFQRCLLLEPSDERTVFRMLRSLLLAERHDALFEEMRTYSYENRELLADIAELETFAPLFRAESPYAALLSSVHPEIASELTRRRNIDSIIAIGFSLGEASTDRSAHCGGFLRFMPEIGLRTLSLKCVYAFLKDDLADSDIGGCIERTSAEHYLRDDENAIISMARCDAQKEFGHIAGWFMERILPLAWILGFRDLPPPDGNPLSDSMMTDLWEFIGDVHEFDNIWNWLRRFPDTRSQTQVVNAEDNYCLAQIAVQQSRAGSSDSVPDDFDPIFNGGVVLERWGSLMWALTPEMPLNAQLF